MDFQTGWRAAMVAAMLCILSSTAYAGTTGVKASPGTLSFGNCIVGARSAAKTVTVTNGTRESVKIGCATLSSSQFAYSGPALPLTLGPGQSFSGSVLFVPKVAQADSGELTFERADQALLSVKLSGTGTAPAPASKVTPTITWSAPAAINYGVALSATVCGGPYNLLTSTPVGTAAYTDNMVQAGSTYYYVVTAIDATTNVQSGTRIKLPS